MDYIVCFEQVGIDTSGYHSSHFCGWLFVCLLYIKYWVRHTWISFSAYLGIKDALIKKFKSFSELKKYAKVAPDPELLGKIKVWTPKTTKSSFKPSRSFYFAFYNYKLEREPYFVALASRSYSGS